MKIRLKFTKTGPIRYVGHLDFMRSFQKGIKKSGLDAVYSSGFNPHMLMSFAAPLGIGEETVGDYVDVDFAYRDRAEMDHQEAYRLQDLGLDNDSLPDPPSADGICRRLTASMPEGVAVTGAVRVGLTKASKAMALVRYASWEIKPLEMPSDRSIFTADPPLCRSFADQASIIIRKKTKSGEKDVDIRPMIRSFSIREDGIMDLLCASGSSVNLKPAAVLEAFATWSGLVFEPYTYRLTRTDLYDAELHPLLELGSPFSS